MSYSFVKTELNNKWDRFIESGPQGSVFSTSAFLIGTGYNIDAYYVKKGNQILGGFVGVEKNGDLIQAPHVIHSGVLFAPHHVDKNAAQRNAIEFDISTFIISQIVHLYKKIEFNLHPNFKDMRPFLWWNYRSIPRFNIDIRYTTLLESVELNNTRNRIIKNSTSETTELFDPRRLCDMYYKTLQAQAQDTSHISVALGVMWRLHEAGKLKMYATSFKGKVGNFIAYGLFNNIAYALYSGGKEGDCAAVGMYNSIHKLNELGYDIIDLEGINSPKRGAFKLSFGGSITPYYQVKLC